MIRLIATDVDGTFCDSNSQFNRERFARQLTEMKEYGILFVIASGNEQRAMYKKFQPFSDDIYFVCDNGCTIFRGNTMLDMATTDQVTADQIAALCMAREELVSLVSCEHHCFMLEKDQAYAPVLEPYFSNILLLPSLAGLSEKVLKFSVVDPERTIDRFTEDLQKDLPAGFRAITAGNECIDIMPDTVSKGTGLRKLMEQEGILPEEAIAFGDQRNDLSMFEAVGRSCAMANAVADLKHAADEVIKSNDEEGVLEVIDAILETYRQKNRP
ncbi:MAG: HAD family phosphatase [Solobacterium sp.]|nr:HAD family phosphatase [Solobacterium sp.]